jgi:hypothetical protein
MMRDLVPTRYPPAAAVAVEPEQISTINVSSEQLLTLSQLAKRLPRRRRDRPIHASTIHRWRHPGVRGVRLECIRIGGAWHTSVQAFQRFCDRLSMPDAVPSNSAPQQDNPEPKENQQYQDLVERELEERGA